MQVEENGARTLIDQNGFLLKEVFHYILIQIVIIL